MAFCRSAGHLSRSFDFLDETTCLRRPLANQNSPFSSSSSAHFLYTKRIISVLGLFDKSTNRILRSLCQRKTRHVVADGYSPNSTGAIILRKALTGSEYSAASATPSRTAANHRALPHQSRGSCRQRTVDQFAACLSLPVEFMGGKVLLISLESDVCGIARHLLICGDTVDMVAAVARDFAFGQQLRRFLFAPLNCTPLSRRDEPLLHLPCESYRFICEILKAR